MKVCLITATKNRHKQLERIVRFVLDQTSNDWVHLIFNNSPVDQRLDEKLDPTKFILINQSICSRTGEPYKTLGDIYIDILPYIPEDCDVLNFMDDDDIFLTSHVEEGIKGLKRGGLLGYKPKKSWFRYGKSIQLAENVLEPSIFVMKEHVFKHGFSLETTAQHLQWVNPLVANNQIYVDPNGPATYICDWSQDIPTFKTSGDPGNPENFNNYTRYSQDFGDKIITPCNESWGKHYRNLKK